MKEGRGSREISRFGYQFILLLLLLLRHFGTHLANKVGVGGVCRLLLRRRPTVGRTDPTRQPTWIE